MMNSPTPWKVSKRGDTTGDGGEISLFDATEEEWIATMNLSRWRTAEDDANLIIAAVNENQNLRQLIQEMLPFMSLAEAETKTKDQWKLDQYAKNGYNKNKLGEVRQYIQNLIQRAEAALKENI